MRDRITKKREKHCFREKERVDIHVGIGFEEFEVLKSSKKQITISVHWRFY